MAEETHKIRGVLYISKADKSDALRDIGNALIGISISEESEALPNYRSCAGGNYKATRRISEVGVELTLYDYNKENLALAIFGSASAAAGSTVTDEAITAKKGGLNKTAKLIDTDQAVVVTGTGGTPVYVEDTDWSKTGAGIIIPSTSAIADDTALEVDYEALGEDAVEGLTNTSQEYRLVVDGQNALGACEPFVVDLFKVRLGAADNLSLITEDEFGEITVSGEALADTTITAAGKSQYLKLQKQSPA